MLLFKVDTKPAQSIDVFTEVYKPAAGMDPEDQRREIENLINQAHLDNQGILRCAIALGEAHSRAHMFVFEVFDGDRLYMIMRF